MLYCASFIKQLLVDCPFFFLISFFSSLFTLSCFVGIVIVCSLKTVCVLFLCGMLYTNIMHVKDKNTTRDVKD